MYDLIQGIAMVIYIAVMAFYGKRYGFSKRKALLLGVIAIAVDYFAIMLLTWIENGFKAFGAQNAVRVFVFNPLFIWIVSRLFKVDYRKYCDFNAFPGMVWYGLGHLACLTTNCCRGFAYHEGTFLYKVAYLLTGTNMLPQQILESVGALLIAAILYGISRKRKFQTNGYMYYLMLILYGSQRFIAEFFRDNKKIIVFGDMVSADGVIGLSSLSLWALAMFVEGVILLTITVLVDRKRKQRALLAAAE